MVILMIMMMIQIDNMYISISIKSILKAINVNDIHMI